MSEMRRDEGSGNETRTCGGVELQGAKNREKTDQPLRR